MRALYIVFFNENEKGFSNLFSVLVFNFKIYLATKIRVLSSNKNEFFLKIHRLSARPEHLFLLIFKKILNFLLKLVKAVVNGSEVDFTPAIVINSENSTEYKQSYNVRSNQLCESIECLNGGTCLVGINDQEGCICMDGFKGTNIS